MRYRKKPVVVEAMRVEAGTSDEAFLDPNTRAVAEVSGWMMGHGFRDFKVHGRRPYGIAIETLEGVMAASPGDWVIRGVQGEFYPCKPDIFEATYEPAEDTPTPRDDDHEGWKAVTHWRVLDASGEKVWSGSVGERSARAALAAHPGGRLQRGWRSTSVKRWEDA